MTSSSLEPIAVPEVKVKVISHVGVTCLCNSKPAPNSTQLVATGHILVASGWKALKGLKNWWKGKPKYVDGNYSHSENKEAGSAWLRCLWCWRFVRWGREHKQPWALIALAPSAAILSGALHLEGALWTLQQVKWLLYRYRSHPVVTAGKSSLQTKDSS